MITRLEELKTQTTQSCLNAITENRAMIMNNDAIKTHVELAGLRTDDDDGNMITQESYWVEEDGIRYRYRVVVAVMVERERA